MKLKKLFLSITFIVFNFGVKAQFHQWAVNMSSTNFISANLDLDSAGVVYSSLVFYDSLVIDGKLKQKFAANNSNIAINKFNSKGQFLWSRVINCRGKRGGLVIFGLRLINNSEFILYGSARHSQWIKFSSTDSLFCSDTSSAFSTGFMVKYDSSGKCLNYTRVYAGKNIIGSYSNNGHLEVWKGEAVIHINTGTDSISILSKSTSSRFKPTYNTTNVLIKYSLNFDSVRWFKVIDVGIKGSMDIRKIKINGGNIYFVGNYGGTLVLGGKIFPGTWDPPYYKGIFGMFDANGNLRKIQQINRDTSQADMLWDISPVDSNHIYLVGLIRDSISYGGKWFSSAGKYTSNPPFRSYPFFAYVSFTKAHWIQLTYHKQDNGYVGTPLFGRCNHDNQKNLYASFVQFNKPIILGGLADTIPAYFGFVKMDSLGNALWIRRIPNYGLVNDFGSDLNNHIVYSGNYSDSIDLTPLKLKSKWNPSAGFITQTYDYQIVRGIIHSGPYCAGDTFKVPYTKLGVFNLDNYFVAELSDEEGNFDGKERELGRIKDTAANTVIGKLPLFQVSSSGKYRIRIRSTSPVVQSYYKLDTLRLLIYSRDKADPGPPETICYGDTLQLNTYGGTKWTWSPKYKMNDSSLRQPLVWPQITTNYKIIIADSSGCGAPDTAIKLIKVHKPLKAIPSFSDTAVCDNSPMSIRVRFEGGDSTNYNWRWFFVSSPKLWFNMNNGQWKLGDTLLYAPSVDSITTEKLAIVLNDNCTNKKDTAFVIIRLQKPINITTNLKDTVLCNGNIFKLQAKAAGGNPINYQWQWKDLTSNTILSINDSLSLKATQTSKIQLILKNGCLSDTSEFTLFVNPPLKGSILYSKGSLHDTTLCFGKNLKLFSSGKGGIGSGYSFQWYLDKILLSNADTLNYVTTNLYSPGGGSKTLKLVLADNCTSGSDSVSRRINVIAGPQANFSWTKTCNKTKVPFTFTGSLAALPVTTRYSWHYPDGDSSVVQNPSKLLSKVGKNLVSLILRSSNGCSDVLTKEVDIKQEAIAQFTAEDVCEDSAVNFINTSQDAMEYEWKFGDGQSDTGQSPKHLYLISGVTGTFNVTLIANVPAGCSDTFTGAVTINANPKSDFNFTTGGNQVNFAAVEIGASNYQWNFGDGGTTNTSTQTTQYTYSKFPSGKYTACLKVSNIAGCNSQTCKEINITGASNPMIKQQGIKIYPNPNTGSFTVETNEAKGNLSIEIYDAIGQIVHKVETFQSSTTLNLKLAEGIYLVRVINESEVYLERVVVGR